MLYMSKINERLKRILVEMFGNNVSEFAMFLQCGCETDETTQK
jgi:hypothetical protein